jgi:trans-aconitate 2-methyltransferase
MTWDPALYLRFEQYRTRPARELLSRIALDEPRTVFDLGCGPGNSTELLFRRWPTARVVGVDADDAMLREARKRHPGGAWEKADIGSWTPPGPPSVIFANAALHWLPDQPRLVARLLSLLEPGGVLAAQVPNNHHAPDHTLVLETLARGPWGARGVRVKREYGACAPHEYYDALAPLAVEVDVWETEYQHVLESPDDVVTWMSGTGLRPALEVLQPEERDAFVAQYTEAIRAAYPQRADGRVLFPFRRLFFVAKK